MPTTDVILTNIPTTIVALSCIFIKNYRADAEIFGVVNFNELGKAA